jgi:deoxyribodipyrimidine photolyase-related protein
VAAETLAIAEKQNIPLASLEGFIRQIIGWREFVRGIYQNFSEQQDNSNFWNHQNKLSQAWYTGETGVPQLDLTIQKVIRYGYCHHIERLMVLGNLMLLLEIHPREAHKWFMEMFVDSSDWVMGPNVYGMALFSDGGIFATKPYICGSNYWRKMSKAKPGEWCDGVDGLYWGFIDKNKAFFSKNPRLSMMAKTIDKMDPARKKTIYSAADDLKQRLTK